VTDEMLRASQPSDEVYQLYKKLGMNSVMVAPMFDGPDPMGTIAIISTSARRFAAADLDFAAALADRASLAVRNARLVRDLGRERDRQRAARVDSERRAAELRAVFNADPNGIALFDAEGTLQLASPRLEEIFGLPL